MTTIYLIRHGTTDSNKKGLFQGSIDIPLNEMGLKQSQYLLSYFRDIHLDAIISSPLTRARQTAAPLCKGKGLCLITFDDIREIDGGLMEGRSMEDNRKDFPEPSEFLFSYPGKFNPPEGESGQQVYNRMIAAMRELALRYKDQTVAVISHGFAIQMYQGYLRGIACNDIERSITANTAVTCATYEDPDHPVLLFANDVSHLPEEYRFVTLSDSLKKQS